MDPSQSTDNVAAGTDDSWGLRGSLPWLLRPPPFLARAAVVRVWPSPKRPGNITPMGSYVVPRAPMGGGGGERGGAPSARCPGAAIDPALLDVLKLPTRGDGWTSYSPTPVGPDTWKELVKRKDPKKRRVGRYNLKMARQSHSAPLRNCDVDEVSSVDLCWHPPLYLTRSLYGYDSDDDSDKWNPPESTKGEDNDTDVDDADDDSPFGAKDDDSKKKKKKNTRDEEEVPDYLIDAD